MLIIIVVIITINHIISEILHLLFTVNFSAHWQQTLERSVRHTATAASVPPSSLKC